MPNRPKPLGIVSVAGDLALLPCICGAVMLEEVTLGDMDNTCRNGSDKGLLLSTGEQESGLGVHIILEQLESTACA